MSSETSKAGTRVTVCRVCSFLEPINTPHGDRCNSRDWIEVDRATYLSTGSEVIMPHPDGGWPEVEITTTYMIYSDDRDVVEAERRRLVAEEGDRIE